jgi:hypothetical protein
MGQLVTTYANPRKGWLEQAQGGAGVMLFEPSNAAFREGRQYFTFLDLSIAQGATQVIKVVIASDTIMRDFFVDMVTSNTTVEIVAGGTEGGTFNSSLTIQRTNNMSIAPERATTTVMTTGGTLTGGTVLDKFLLYAGNNANQSTRQHGGEDFPVGFPAGTYYVRIVNIGNTTATGLFKARWSEDA